MDWYRIYVLCNRYDWFNAGSCEQYERLRNLVKKGATVREVAIAIWVCTCDENGETIETIAEKIRAEVRE